MKSSDHSDLPLRELCFDYAAGIVDRQEFHALIEASLQLSMACEKVHVRCRSRETAAQLEKLKGAGWFAESTKAERLLHAALSQNGRLVGMLSCSRAADAAEWTRAEGVALLRYATILATHMGCPQEDRVSVTSNEGVSL